MNFVTYNMVNTSTRTDTVNNITIEIRDAISSEVKGTARMTSFDDIWLELPEVQGRYQLRVPAKRQLENKFINNLDDLFHYAWLVSNGSWILHHIKKVRA